MNKTTPTNSTPDIKTLFAQMNAFLDEYLGHKAPALPTNAKEAIVKYSPYISMVVVFLGVFVSLGVGTLLAPLALLGGYHFSLGTLVALVGLGLEAAAIPGLFARKLSAWNLMYYGALVNALYQLLRLDLGSMIIGTALSLYILFQVKSYYKN